MIAKFSVVEEGVEIPEDSNVWYFSHICRGAKIGHKVNIGDGCYIGEGVIVGDEVRIGNNVSLYEGIIVKDRVFIGNGAVFTNVRKPKVVRKSKRYLITVIEEGASIGANSTLVAGVRIGKNAIIADGASVAWNVPDWAYVVGNPARLVSIASPTYEQHIKL